MFIEVVMILRATRKKGRAARIPVSTNNECEQYSLEKGTLM